jgi:hypothetical protein
MNRHKNNIEHLRYSIERFKERLEVALTDLEICENQLNYR